MPVKGVSQEQADTIEKIEQTPVGGIPGNHSFWTVCQLAARGTVFALLMSFMVWSEGTKGTALERFRPYMPLAICIYIFTLNPIFGQVVNNATAGLWGTFAAVLNIFIMRGFFADGVEPDDSSSSPVVIAGWVNFLLFDLLFLVTECRMGTRMFALANHTGFMLAFLNPMDQTPYSKNFKINVNGTAVSSFLGVAIGCFAAIVAMCIPYPWGFGTNATKANAKAAAEDTSKMFVAAVRYFNGDKATVIIEQLLSSSVALKKGIDGLGGAISASWNEHLDVGVKGTVRHLMMEQQALLGKIFDTLHSLEIAMSTEDFGPTHKACMADIGDAAMALAIKTSVLLLKVTEACGDGDISSSEKAELEALGEEVRQARAELSSVFDAHRKKGGKPVSKELLSESFFVFGLSSYARRVLEFSDLLCTHPPQGTGFGAAMSEAIVGTFKPANPYWQRFTFRYFAGLVLCMIYSVVMDGYGGACAITAVFLLTTKVGPDMMTTLNCLLAIVVGAVVGAVLFSYCCLTGVFVVLPIVTAIYWLFTMQVAFGGSSFALIGIFMAALAPFTLVAECPKGVVNDAAAAVGLWGGIRGCIIAMVIMSVCEVASQPGMQSRLAVDALNGAFKHVQHAFDDMWADKSPDGNLATVGGELGSAAMFNGGAKLEPRFWNCPWKFSLMEDVVFATACLRLDCLTLRAAMEGSDGDTDQVVHHLAAIDAFGHIKEDLTKTLEDAREMAVELLTHGTGPLHVLDKLDSVEGLDELDGFDTAIDQCNTLVKFPGSPPDSMEDDELCQLSIVFVMVDYTVKHIASIIKACIRKQL